MCLRHKVPKLNSDKALAVKGTVISSATWRHLTGAETKEKEKVRMSEPTLKSGDAKSMPAPTPAKSLPEEPMPTNLRKYLLSINRNHEAVFKKIQRMEHKSIKLYHYINGRDNAIREVLSRIVPYDMPTFPLFPNSLFAGDCSLPPTPTSSDATKSFTLVVEESAKSKSEETQKKPPASAIPATSADSANIQASSDHVQIVEEVLKDLGTSAQPTTRRFKWKVEGGSFVKRKIRVTRE
ncbi:hypothetical protein V6N12_029007 [Hibiscus sabdariffa]|uniref:Uncharacterized protein n=1 Tax=Hibiscus sabdariffa TaxID=183260 RepID=A0ABR2F7K2_9ROSI